MKIISGHNCHNPNIIFDRGLLCKVLGVSRRLDDKNSLALDESWEFQDLLLITAVSISVVDVKPNSYFIVYRYLMYWKLIT